MINSPLETDIFNYHTPEFFINIKNIPDKTSKERKPFVLEEKRKCREGININGVFIPGCLYFHLNYYNLSRDATPEELASGSEKKIISLPTLRDNEWIAFNDYDQLCKNPKIYTLFGARQVLKSEFECSLTLRELSLFKNTEALATFQADHDKDTFVKKMRIAIEHGQKFMIVPNIDKSWDKSEIRFGYTKQDNSIELRGTLYIYNTQEGKKIQVGSGKTPTFFFSDECAKALRHGSKVYYEDRVGSIEDVKVGERIYGKDGKLTTVLGVFPQGLKELYKIILRDGREIECCGDHLWTVFDNSVNRYKTLNTKDIYENYKSTQIDNRYNKVVNKYKYFVPINEPIDYKEQSLEIEPYYLGIWLGDGTSDRPYEITNIEEEVIEYIKYYSNNLGLNYHKKDNYKHLLHKSINKRKKENFSKLFRSLGVIDNKHIPSKYLYNSVENRLELLKGLMDTDGSCSKSGAITFTNKNKTLIKDVMFLIRSLGINCSLSEFAIKNSTYYKITLFTDLPVFKVKRKLKNYNKTLNKKSKSYKTMTSIVSIEPTLTDYATCIRVDNEDSLFLTTDFIPTHNSPFRAVYDTVEPALLTDYGTLRCVPLFTFTGGEVEKAKDAENLVKYPSSEKQFITTLDSGQSIGGRFLNAVYRKDFKKPKKFHEFIGKKTGTWLDDYTIMVSDKEFAMSVIENERKEAAKSPDSNTLLLKKIFSPITLEDVFLSESNNKFPVAEIESHLISLENYEPSYVDLYRNDKNEVTWRFSDLKPIDKFPVAPKDFKDAPFIIYEHPQYGVPHGTYCIGVDPYNEDTSSDKINSLGAVYVYKRMYNPMGEFQNSIVASWRGRKKEIKQFHELVLMIAEYYKAIEGVLPENEDKTLIQYFFFKKKGHYLADSFELAKQINPTTRSNRLKGLSASTVNQRHYMNLMYAETKDDICVVDESGNETIKMGVYNIPDKMLLVEMKNYRGKTSGKGVHDGNFDSIIAYGHCLTLARYYDVKYPTAGRWKPEPEEEGMKKPPKVKLPWGTYEQAQNNLFIKPKRNYRPINRMFI